MRLLLALMALVGVLMTPVAASAGAAFCFGHAGEMAEMTKSVPVAHHTDHAADHSCCDEQDAAPAHDDQACAKACAAMCVTATALSADVLQTLTPIGRSVVEAVPLKTYHAHPPPGLKRPPRSLA